ncbi:hypothetical protein TcCL_ESM03072, partial [Trypanosoma cruzi]
LRLRGGEVKYGLSPHFISKVIFCHIIRLAATFGLFLLLHPFTDSSSSPLASACLPCGIFAPVANVSSPFPFHFLLQKCRSLKWLLHLRNIWQPVGDCRRYPISDARVLHHLRSKRFGFSWSHFLWE